MPSDAIPGALEEYKAAVSRAADALVATLQKESTTRAPNVEALRRTIQASIGGEQHATPELADAAETLQHTFVHVGSAGSRPSRGRPENQRSTRSHYTLIDLAANLVAACERHARSLHRSEQIHEGVFVRLNPSNLTADVDQLLNHLGTGTYLRQASLREIRDVLDRKSFVREAIGHVQFIFSGRRQRRFRRSCCERAEDRTRIDGSKTIR